MSSSFYILSSTILVLLFLCVGSFCNVLIYRIPKGEQFVNGRSYCPKCNHTLAWYDNIPLLSYILLGGNCRYCKESIPFQYPLVEFLNMLLDSCVAIYFLYTVDLLSKPYLIVLPILYGMVSCLLITLSIIDFKTLEIPMGFNITLFCIGIAITLLQGNFISHILGMLSISTLLFLAFILTKGNGIGLGDVKLMFACGLILGWKGIVVGFLIGSIIAIIVHTIRMKIANTTNVLAFGPYLSIGVYIGIFIGEPIMNMYINFLNNLITG